MAAEIGPRAGSVSSSRRAPSSRRLAVPSQEDPFADAPTEAVVPGSALDDPKTDVMERRQVMDIVDMSKVPIPTRLRAEKRLKRGAAGQGSSSFRPKVATSVQTVLDKPASARPPTPPARFEKSPTEPLIPPAPAGKPARRADPSPAKAPGRDERILAGYAKSGAVAVPSFNQAAPAPSPVLRRHKKVRKVPKKGFWRFLLGIFR